MTHNIIAFGIPSGPELIVILVVILLLFGAKRLPELARGMGKSIREFKKATSEVEDDIRDALKEDPKPQIKAEEKKSEKPADEDSKKSE